MSDWLAQGQDYLSFWDLTPREIILILRGGVAKAQAQSDIERQQNYELAHLVAFAFHDPKAMPRFADAGQDTEKSDEVAQAQVRGFFIAMSKKSGG